MHANGNRTHWQTWLKSLAEVKALVGNTKAEMVLKQLMEQEQQCRDARAIRYATRRYAQGVLDL
jgi:pyruvate dehydrogenase complex dehydrogenase (E1) component